MLKLITSLLLFGVISAEFMEVIPLNQKWLNPRMVGQYSRGKYLIVLSKSFLNDYLSEPVSGDFVTFKKSQGYDVDVISMDTEGFSTTNPAELKNFLMTYSEENPMLEYVLLIGDIDGPLTIPTHFIPSINEPENDVTDYPYSVFHTNPNDDDYDMLSPKFIIGRWSVRSGGDFINIKVRSIQYTRMEQLSGVEIESYSRGLLVAGNYSNNDGVEIDPASWPVTPVWTSRWLYDTMSDYGFAQIDTAYFYAENQVADNTVIINAWNNGIGIVNYRGWGNSHGWHFPAFHIDDLESLTNGWKLPVVGSFVCNTGDFGANLANNGPVKCFGEELITRGTPTNPKGAVAVIGPSDLDTDTRYNNVICGNYWRALLTGETAEIGVALHIGKQSLIDEFPQLTGNGDVVEFYHHIYSVLGDPSLPVWLLTPGNLSANIESDPQVHHSFVTTWITDENGDPVEEVVGALLLGTQLVGKGLSTPMGQLDIDFSDIPEGSTLSLYLNKPQFRQKKMDLVFLEDDGTPFNPQIWTAFDIQPILSTGEGFIHPGESVNIALNVSNPSEYTLPQVEISLSSLTDDAFFGSFSTETADFLPFTSMTTGTMFSGDIGEFPISSRVYLRADFSMNGVNIAESEFPLAIGPISETDPLSPDEYGYWAYDNFDTGYDEAPVYEWIELNPDTAGSGTNLWLTDDSHILIQLPFDFIYYGDIYENMTVGSNGWLSMIPCNIDYFWNFSIPMYMGPSGMIAPFMDDLDDDGGNEPFDVFKWYDETNNRFIVEWSNVANGEDDEFCQTTGCIRETFEVIFNDPAFYQTQTGDGEIIFQYKEIHDIDANGNYSTIGIESPDQTDGLQYLFCNIPQPGAWWHVDAYQTLTEDLAIKFTTTGPSIAGCGALGDLNQDGALDILDIVRAVSIIMGDDPTPAELLQGDVTCDGALDILDIVRMVSIILVSGL